MQEKKCKQCNEAIPITENYVAPFIKCPSCGSHERITPQFQEKRLKIAKSGASSDSVKYEGSVLNDAKYFEQTLGKEGLAETYKLVADYMLETNIAKRRTMKSKALQTVMRKYKVAVALVSQTFDYAEKSDVTQEIIATTFRKKQVVRNVSIAFAVAILIGAVLAFF